jgi:hypothetical protein
MHVFPYSFRVLLFHFKNTLSLARHCTLYSYRFVVFPPPLRLAHANIDFILGWFATSTMILLCGLGTFFTTTTTTAIWLCFFIVPTHTHTRFMVVITVRVLDVRILRTAWMYIIIIYQAC